MARKEWQAPGWEVRPGRIDNLLTAWDSSGFRCSVTFPGLTGEKWEFDRIDNPYVLYQSVAAFSDTFGVQPTYPQRAAREIFLKTLPYEPDLLTDDPDNYWKVFADKMESEFIWLGKLTKKDRQFKYVHAFDKRMMFLSAARGAMFGMGHCEEISNIKWADISNAVGLVKLKKHKFENNLDKSIPGFFKELFGKGDIFYTPYLSVFQGKHESFVNDLEIEKGFIWRTNFRLFEKFGKGIGDVIKSTRPENNPGGVVEPEQAVIGKAAKNLYTRFFGWLGRLENRTGFAANLYRPDWRGLIVSSAGANLLRNILNVYRMSGKLPIGINHDALLYLSDHEDPFHEFHGSDLFDKNKFTHEWTADAAAVFELIDAGKNATQICSHFKRGESDGN